ncbi:uncharacterized protein LOC119739831 [Patiria miniata]|uniref:Uncharacterized protein n=1 Tax=Patiria miniata TaxID=46514 RepID=A0A914B5V6_PATMI|nr:uncharacterized protein LOC119739831 [Patiria miniata]
MLFHPSYPFCFVVALTISLSSLSSSQDTTDEPFSCYQGTIQSNTRGQIKHHSERKLTPLPCEEPMSHTTTMTTQPTSTAASDTGENPSQTPAQPTVAPVTTSQPQNASLVSWCTATLHPSSTSVSTNSTWTANFSCMLATAECPKNGRTYCCKTSNCNNLKFFKQHTGFEIATVNSCHKTGSHNGTGPVPVYKCPGGSEYCYNRTADGVTSFGCSSGRTQISCRNITLDNKSRCVKVGKSILCCCASDNCNGLASNASSVIPTVPTTTHYLVTASKPSSNWTLVLIIACGVLFGGLIGVASTVLYKRWKKKQNANGPLNISYSRVSADFADDDNVFSY